MKTMFGILGCEHSHIGIFVGEMLQLGHGCVGIYEPSRSKVALALAEKFQIPLLSDKRALFAPHVSIIGSSAINNEKIELIEECAANGKHIMVDKPAVTDRRGCERLQTVIERGGIQIGMLLTERFQPAILALKSLIDRGTLGKVISIEMRKPHLLKAADRPQWFFSKSQSGGILVDLLIHDLDLLHWLTGETIARTSGYAAKHVLTDKPEFYDTVLLQVLMRNHVTAHLHADWHTPEKSWTWGDGRIFATGTEGTAEVRLNGDPFVKRETLLLLTTNSEGPAQAPLQQPEWTITEDFLRRIAGLSSYIGHQDIVAASQAAVDAEETVELIRSAHL
jgi:predicted dehydrogenase